MERNLITGIAARQERGAGHADRRARRAGHGRAIFGPLAEADINVDMIVHAATPDTGSTRPHLHRARAPSLSQAIGGAREGARTRSASTRLVTDDARRQGQHRRRRHALQRRQLAAKMFETLAERADQHPRDLDQRDQGQRADRRGPYRARGARAPHRLRPRRGGGGMSGEGLIAEPRRSRSGGTSASTS